MSIMKQIFIVGGAAISLLVGANPVAAQTIVPRSVPQLNLPPPPPSPPPPKITVPVVPRMDAPATPNYQPPSRPSFSDRAVRCLDDAAAAGLGPGDREAYSRACANQQ